MEPLLNTNDLNEKMRQRRALGQTFHIKRPNYIQDDENALNQSYDIMNKETLLELEEIAPNDYYSSSEKFKSGVAEFLQ